MDIKELVNVFNLNNYFSERINTNFTVEGRKIVGLFADDTDVAEYLHRIGEEIIKQQYSSREVAGRYYNLNYFPFVLGANPNKKKSNIKGVMEVKLADSANREVIHNLKIHLVNEFRRAVILKLIARLQKAVGITEEKAHEWIGETFRIGAIGKSSSYLCCIAFSDEYLKRRYDSETFELLKGEYIKEFNSRLRECGLKSSDFYDNKGDMLYIKNVSDKVVKSIAEYVKGRIALDFETPGEECSKVENFKDVFSSLIFKHTEKFVDAYGDDIFVDEGEIGSGNSFVLIPLTKTYDGQLESLKHKDAYKINAVYNKKLVSDIRGKTAKPHVTNCQNPVYAISNKGIAQLLPKIMESAITYNKENKRFEFAVDPGNFRRRDSIRGSQFSSTVTSPFNSPIHAEPSGLRTPPEQTGDRFKGDRDSGIGDSPPQLKDSVAHSSSGGPGPSTELSDMEWESPTRSPDGALKDSPRQESGVLHHHIGAAEVGAAENVPAGTSASNPCSSPAPGARFWPQVSSFVSGPSSSKGASERRTSALTEKEKELIEALLYTFNLINYTLDGVYTNFFAKDGEIVSLLHDSVDREKYLQAVRDYIIEEYCEDEEEAREVYDLDEFPFKFLPDPDYEKNKNDCEKNPKKTVVANISSGALSNLKILFSQRFEKNVDAIDINWVKDVEKREKYEWVDYQLSNRDSLEEACEGYSPDKKAIEEACEGCFPDEGAMKKIPIAFEEGEYVLDRSRDTCEVELLFREQLRRFRDTSVAGKGKSEDNNDTGISSGEATDAENVSSKAEEKTSDYCSMSEPEPMDYQKSSPMQQQNSSQNTGGGSPKHPNEDEEPNPSPKFKKQRSGEQQEVDNVTTKIGEVTLSPCMQKQV